MTVILISLSHWGMHEVPATCGVREFIRTYCGDPTRAVEILEDGPIPSPRASDIIIIDDTGGVPNEVWSGKSEGPMFKIGDLVEVSPNNEYYADWKGVVLEITGVYRSRGAGYRTENKRPPIMYSVKDIKDGWTCGYTDDFSFDDLIAAAPEEL